jgi:hypothetical protein
MPTPDDLRSYQQWLGRFINALWDAENVTELWAIDVREIRRTIAADEMPEPAFARLVNDLVGDGLVDAVQEIAEMSYPISVKLTSAGRSEVQRWITKDEPTEHFQLAPSQIFTTNFYGSVTGSPVLVGSDQNTVNVQTAVNPSIAQLLEKMPELLSTWQGSDDDRDSIEADFELVQQHAADPSARPGRVKAALGRIALWAGTAVSGALASEVQRLASDAISRI